jgi:large subunit ribosomal protein L20
MRVKHHVASRARRKKVLGMAKGYWGDRSKHYRRAIETVRRALVYSYRDRRAKKREFRALWITRINAATRELGITYRAFMQGCKAKNINLSRDMLAKVAAEYPDVFGKIVAIVKSK